MAFELTDAVFVVEECALEGVKRIALKVIHDVKQVSGADLETDRITSGHKKIVLCATHGHSRFLDTLITNDRIDVSGILGKREVYQIQLLKKPFDGVEEALVICGSDKRGTIYGMFALSEYIGVSPLCFWGDVKPVKRESLVILEDIRTVSREPDILYRGFFINDEWPCFGNWTFSHFGGFTAEMYDHVFELLLRLKGNYLWPAMWTSSFPLDGPGSLNQELADLYGVVIGFSHHEPCLRASEEWDQVRGPSSPYGNEWNFYTNRQGLTKYWEDALAGRGKYEQIITIGMRGERDSSMLGEDATLAQNIELLKDILTVQQELIRNHVNRDLSQVPRLLALYKEVEAYYYGDEQTPGLKDWDGLQGVTCMLCEDNYGYMRTLPPADSSLSGRKFGMYYHFDYHGSPISYEWMPSTPFSKIWEQMCMAYDYGVRDVWIVNVGDLKGNEISLAYFMELAYDFQTWGSSAPGSWDAFISQWLKRTFPAVDETVRAQMGQVLVSIVDMNGMRRPEALHAGIYHPCHDLETDRMLARAEEIERINEAVCKKLAGAEKAAYYSMIDYPAKASINLLRMHLYAGKNAHYAVQGKTVANSYGNLVTSCIEENRRLAAEFAAFQDGKWRGMELEQHIGFVKWNEDNCRYPIRMQVEPAYKPRMIVSRKDSEEIATKSYDGPMTISIDDFLYEGNREVILEIANDGIGEIHYTITVESKASEADGSDGWLFVTPQEGTVRQQEEVVLACDRSRLTKETKAISLLISDGETEVRVIARGKSTDTEGLPDMTFLQNCYVIAMEANHYASCQRTAKGSFQELSGYGRSGCGMKVFPTTADFTETEQAPSLTYQFLIEEAGEYQIELWMAPTNSVRHHRPLRVGVQTSAGELQPLEVLSADFKAGNGACSQWCRGVLDQIRVCRRRETFEKGVQAVTVSALEAGLVLERVLVYPVEHPPKASYSGPQESCYKEGIVRRQG